MGKFYNQMEQNLKISNHNERTRKQYLDSAKAFVAHFMKPPTELGETEIREYMLYLIESRKVSPSTQKGHLAAIKYLYVRVLNRPEVVESIPYPKIPKSLPDILLREEVEKILALVTSLKHRAILFTTYGAGLRAKEACSLQVDDIDSRRGVIHVRKGKGSKDRYVMLSDRLLHILREYYQVEKPPKPYLFPGQPTNQPLCYRALSRGLARAVKKAGIKKHVTTHSMRHSFATHLLEGGTDISVIRALLGHGSIRTTVRYARVTTQHLSGIKSPLDLEPAPQTPASS